MRRILLLAIFLISAPAWATTYYMSTSGSDAANGLTIGTAWASPNHALNCGDIILAQAGTYNPNSFAFGPITCSAGNNVTWLSCSVPFSCIGNVTSGGQFAQGFGIGVSYWGVQNWVVSTYSGGGGCGNVIPATSSTSIHHIIFANNIANGCGQGGFQSSTNGAAGVDYFVVIGNIVYNAVQGTNICASGINAFEPVASDSLPGTHYYFAGNFSYGNIEGAGCSGGGFTDGEGLFFDTVQPYSQQLVMDNNLAVFNGASGLKLYNNSTGTPNAKVYFRHNTTFGNEISNVNGDVCGEITSQSGLSLETYLNLSVVGTTGCTVTTMYVFNVDTVNGTTLFYKNYGYNVTGNNTGTKGSNAGFSYGPNNTFSNPSLANPTNPSAPSCGGFTTTTACMATVIANFTPTAAAAKSYGYQIPSATSVFDPLYPQWLCTVTNLPAGLVTPGCVTGSFAGPGVTIGAGGAIH